MTRAAERIKTILPETPLRKRMRHRQERTPLEAQHRQTAPKPSRAGTSASALEDCGEPLSAADAHGFEPIAAIAAAQFAQQIG